MISKAEKFLDLYKKLEGVLRRSHPEMPKGDGAIPWAYRNLPECMVVAGELDYCREVRNLLQHKAKVGKSYLVEPSDAMIETMLGTIEKVTHPDLVSSVFVKKGDVRAAKMDDLVRPVMREMVEKTYTHVPILEDGRVVGVFSENTLLSFLMGDTLVEIADDATFAEFSSLLPLDAHESEVFEFIGINELAYTAAGRFRDALKRKERIGMLFVTASGEPDEELLGILTAWDMAAYF